jgi:undecaprenyl-diphosphatase
LYIGMPFGRKQSVDLSCVDFAHFGFFDATQAGMNFLDAIILGIVEGLTEYLPVSSTGHLILVQRILGIPESPQANAYAICIQAGAIVAVLGLYRRRVVQMLRGIGGQFGLSDASDEGFRLAQNIVVAFLPAAVVGVLFNDWIERQLFGLWPIVAAWFFGGLAILVVSAWRRGHDTNHPGRALGQLAWKGAATIGVIQCLAMWPGTSRSLVTIVGGLLVGLSLPAAVEFSFLLGVVTLLAATVYKAADAGPLMLRSYGWPVMLVGSAAAYVSAVLAVKWMVRYLNRHGLGIFAYYRILLALTVAAAILLQRLSPT